MKGPFIGLTLAAMFLAGMVFGQQKPFTVTAYYSGNATQVQQYAVGKCTHIIYSFLHLYGNRLGFSGEPQKEALRSLVALKKQHPGLKILVSLGGWGGCGPCSDVFSTAAGQKEFASSVKDILEEYGADGLDLDWEYPAIEGYPGHRYRSQDRLNFTVLLKTLRDTLGPKRELSFAAGGFSKFLEESIDWPSVLPYVDRINLMTYDLVNGNSTVTGHHTPLYSTPQQLESTNHCVTTLLNMGVPASKLIIGAAFYGRSFRNVDSANHGLYQPAEFKSFIPFRVMEEQISKSQGYQYYFDEVAKAPSWYNARKREFVTYDSPESIRLKTKYALQQQLGGIMFWELTLDKPSGGLLDAIDEARHTP